MERKLYCGLMLFMESQQQLQHQQPQQQQQQLQQQRYQQQHYNQVNGQSKTKPYFQYFKIANFKILSGEMFSCYNYII